VIPTGTERRGSYRLLQSFPYPHYLPPNPIFSLCSCRKNAVPNAPRTEKESLWMLRTLQSQNSLTPLPAAPVRLTDLLLWTLQPLSLLLPPCEPFQRTQCMMHDASSLKLDLVT
jgi:hypothetical protein